MTTTSVVDPDQLAQHLASMYRDVSNERVALNPTQEMSK